MFGTVGLGKALDPPYGFAIHEKAVDLSQNTGRLSRWAFSD